MSTEQKPPLIYGRIADAIADVEAVGKTHRNQQQGYNFRSIDEFYDKMNPVLVKHRIFVAPTILEHAREERTTKSGSIMMTTITKVRFKIFAEDGSFIEADALGEGADSGDKSANKAAASAMKYLFMQVFAVRVTEESLDTEASSPQYAPNKPKPPQNTTPAPPTPPKADSDRKQATPADVIPKKPTEKLKERMFAVLAERFPTDIIVDYSKSVFGGIGADSDWPIEKVPVSRPEMDTLLRDVEEFAKQFRPPIPDDDLPPEIADVVIHVPPRGMKREDYLKNPDTIGSLYAARHDDEEARKRLWGFVSKFEANGWTKDDGTKMPPSAADIALRKALDAFDTWYATKGGSQ